MKNANNISAFSLLEMAITITIISLLIAAVLAGKDMKHRQELNQVATDIAAINTAVTQFKSIYSNYYPGDFYTSDTGTNSLFSTSGNGNNILDTGTPDETLLFWQHLNQADLIPGSYDGTNSDARGLMETPFKNSFYFAHKNVNAPSAAINPDGRLLIQVSQLDGSGVFTTKELELLA